MDRIAFVIGHRFVYWSALLLVLGVGTAVCAFISAYLYRGGTAAAASAAVPLCMVLSVILSRLVHAYFRPDSYSGLAGAMTDYTSGSYALPGAFLGGILAALLLRLLRLGELLPLLDAMSIGGSAGIAVGRLAGFFTVADRGMPMAAGLPLAWPVLNAVTGQMEVRLATFFLQSLAAAAICFVLLLSLRRKPAAGEITLRFLLLYGASQTILDSTRYDSLYLRSNGFLRVTQILAALAVIFACTVQLVRLTRRRGFRYWQPILWLSAIALLGGAGYLEYYVQRHGDRAAMSYGLMTVCLSGLIAIAESGRAIGVRKKG